MGDFSRDVVYMFIRIAHFQLTNSRKIPSIVETWYFRILVNFGGMGDKSIK